MEVMNPVNYEQIQEKINGLSKQYFSYSTSIKDRDISHYKPFNRSLHIAQQKTRNFGNTGQKQKHSLVVWGCGEFGQHGLDQNGDVTFEMALSKYKCGEMMLPNSECPVFSVCGSSHTLVLTGTSHVYSWGNGTSGQLGNGTCLTAMKPTLVPLSLDDKIRGMSCGARHSFIWTENGYCYSFGNNFNAQLGYNFSKADFKENQLQPVLVELFPDMKVNEVACGARHSLFLLCSGRVMAVGCNQHGQIGNDTTEDVVIPSMLDDLHCITHIACGNIHSLASHENGEVYAWGYGKAFGNKTRHVASPQKFTLKDIESSVVKSLDGGDCHSMVLYDNGVVFAWGNNYEGQLGVGEDVKYQSVPRNIPTHLLPRPVIQISCGETTSAAVTGKGQLFMWGKNAGLIRSEKPSQYFQYTPQHIEMDGLSVAQISCGAWHVSAIVKNCTKGMEEISENEETELFEFDKEDNSEVEKSDTVKSAGLFCENEDSLQEIEEHVEDDKKYRNESVRQNEIDSSPDNCFITRYSSQADVLRDLHDNGQLTDSSQTDMCCIDKYSSHYELSRVDRLENECNEVCKDKTLAVDQKQNEYSKEVILDQRNQIRKTHKSNVYESMSHVEKKTSCRNSKISYTNGTGDNCQKNDEESRFSGQQENCLQHVEEAHISEKQSDLSSNSFLGNSFKEKVNNNSMFSHLPTRTSWPVKTDNKMDVEKSEGGDVAQNGKATSYCATRSGKDRNLEFDRENKNSVGKGENNKNTSNEFIDFRNVKNCRVMNCSEDNGRKNDGLTSSTKNELNKNSFNNCNLIGVNTAEVGVDTNNEIEKEGQLKHWNDCKPCNQVEKTLDVSSDKSISSDISGLSVGSSDEKLSKKTLVVKRNIKLAITPLQENMIKKNLTWKRNAEIKLTATSTQNKAMEQTTGLKQTLMSTHSETIDSYDHVFTRPQTVPAVIDLSFGSAVCNGQTERSRIKSSFTTFKNVLKASNLFREKQKQKKIAMGTNRRVSDGVFTLESMLPNRPMHAVKEIEKWSKAKEDPRQSKNISSNSSEFRIDASHELVKKTDKLSKCCSHHTGELLPPICSCKRNGVLIKQRDTLTNVFIDRR